ncbi:ABC transporter ATP-binding protein [Myroides injenensis]|uniref:ABC transporter ATP-binding protein n=1 Tax=Myroides injenensis TaxID=1183151 RepID=UPI00028A221E|nr:ABC transporter ATP-binding protein [Myroides injenensis]
MATDSVLWRIVKPVKKKLNFAMALSVGSTVLTIGNLILLSYLINAMYQGNTQQMFYLFSGMVLFVVVSYLLRLKSFDVSHYAAFDLEAILRKNITNHLAKLPLGFLNETGSGALTKILNEDVRLLHGFVADSTPLFVRTYAFPLLTLLSLFWFDYRIALVCLAILIVGLGFLSLAMKNKTEVTHQFNKAKEDINVAVVEYVQAMPVVRVFDGGEKSFVRYENALQRYLDIITLWYKQNGLNAKLSMFILNPLPTFIILLVLGTYWYQNGSLSFLAFIASLLLGTGMIESILPYRSLSNVISRAAICSKRIEELMKVEPLQASGENKNIKDISVVFDNVSFTYPGREDKALEDINFTVKPGTFTAITGASGAGKSTIARLLPRFWDVSKGYIKIGDTDIRDLEPEVLLDTVAFVFQDNFIFSDTIANNIRMGAENASIEQVMEAAKAAQIHDFIMQLPEGYETLVKERGGNFSGGQKQRLSIARAILRNKPILVLDEVTSFSDTENELLLMRAFRNLMKDKTVIMIAHRLETIKNADQILVMDRGRVSELGNHEQLIEQKGIYSSMWQSYLAARNWHIKSEKE